MKTYSICNARRRGRLDLKVVVSLSLFHTLSVTSNKSGLLIQRKPAATGQNTGVDQLVCG